MGLKSFVLHPQGHSTHSRGPLAGSLSVLPWGYPGLPWKTALSALLDGAAAAAGSGPEGRVQGEPTQNRPDAFIGVVFPGLRSCWVFCSEQARCTMGWGTRTTTLVVVGVSQAFWGTSTKQVANSTAYTTGTDTR